MSLTKPRSFETPTRGRDAVILVVLLVAVALVRSFITRELGAPRGLTALRNDGLAVGEPAPENPPTPAPASAPQATSQILASLSTSAASTEARPKLRDPSIPRVSTESRHRQTIREVRASSIADQSRVEELVETLRQNGHSESDTLIEAIAVNDQIVTLGLALAIRSRNEPLPMDFGDRVAKLIAYAPADVRLGAIEAAGVVGRPFPRILESLRSASHDRNVRIGYRARAALKRIAETTAAE